MEKLCLLFLLITSNLMAFGPSDTHDTSDQGRYEDRMVGGDAEKREREQD